MKNKAINLHGQFSTAVNFLLPYIYFFSQFRISEIFYSEPRPKHYVCTCMVSRYEFLMVLINANLNLLMFYNDLVSDECGPVSTSSQERDRQR
jgi:hypothetical protein